MLKTKAKANGECEIGTLSRSEIVAILETKTRKRLGMSAKRMLKKYRAGKLEEVGDVADLIILSSLLPKNDPLFA